MLGDTNESFKSQIFDRDNVDEDETYTEENDEPSLEISSNDDDELFPSCPTLSGRNLMSLKAPEVCQITRSGCLLKKERRSLSIPQKESVSDENTVMKSTKMKIKDIKKALARQLDENENLEEEKAAKDYDAKTGYTAVAGTSVQREEVGPQKKSCEIKKAGDDMDNSSEDDQIHHH